MRPAMTNSGADYTATHRTDHHDVGPTNPNRRSRTEHMRIPDCDGTGIVVLGNATQPGSYATEIQNYLDTRDLRRHSSLRWHRLRQMVEHVDRSE